jgi:hypothetical protein
MREVLMNSLADIRTRVIEIIGKPDFLPFVNARLVLRTGMSLTADGMEHSADDLYRVIVALEEMGYPVDDGEKTLRRVTKK